MGVRLRGSAGADPQAITLNFAGADGVEISRQGDLVVHTAAGDVVHEKPYLYQELNGVRHTISGNFVLDSALSTQHAALVSFDIGAYDAMRPLVIDPVVLGYSTYLGGGSSEYPFGGIAVDSAGNAYVSGGTKSTNFPTTPGAFDTGFNAGVWDAFVTKLNPDGSALVYSTYLGGSDYDASSAIAVDSAGSAYLAGPTDSFNFPTSLGAFDTTYNGGGDGFAAKLSPSGGVLIYGTYLGGSGTESAGGIAVDHAGAAYVTGYTKSLNFPPPRPTASGAFDTSYNGGYSDVFAVKLSGDGDALVYGTYLGGLGEDTGYAIAVDTSGNAYVTGHTASSNFPSTPGAFDTSYNGDRDVYVAKLSPSGDNLAYATYLGGSGYETPRAITVDAASHAYVVGETDSLSFPTTPGAFDTTQNGYTDAFVTKLNASGSALDYGTYLGGSYLDIAFGIDVDSAGNAYVTGHTASVNFPTTPDAFDTSINGDYDVFVAKLSSDGGVLAYGTYLGGTSTDEGLGIALDGAGNAYMTGVTSSTNFPTTPGAFDTTHNGGNCPDHCADVFVSKFSGLAALPVTARGDV